MNIEQLFAQYGFTVEEPHQDVFTGVIGKAYYAAGDDYRETACYVFGDEIEIDVATNVVFYGPITEQDRLITALEAAKADIKEFVTA